MSLEIDNVNGYNTPEELVASGDDGAASGVLKIGFLIVRRHVEGAWELPMLGQTDTHLGILNWCYHIIVFRKLCPPIEGLSDDYKKELWDTVRKEVAPDCNLKNRLLRLTKAVYTVNEMAKLIYKNETD